MKRLSIGGALLIAATGILAAWGCMRSDSGHGDHDEGGPGHAEHSERGEETARGPMGGRLFAADELQLELMIEEEDGPPVFVAWLYDEQGDRLSPEAATLTVTLRRLGDRVDVITFSAMGHHLRGRAVVEEPHSFDATIELGYGERSYEFAFAQREFRVDLSPEAVTRAGVETAAAGPAHIDVSVSSPGEVRLNTERMLIVRPRFPGVVVEMGKRLGDSVDANDVLAVIQSNSSLTEYNITAPMAGRIVARSGMVGAAVDNGSVLYTLADLSSVWVDFAIYPQHVGVIKRGQPVTVVAATQPDLVAEGSVSYVGPLLEEDTRVSHGRIVLPNTDGRWQPGLYVNVIAIVDHAEVAVSVPDDAIIRSKFGPSVFLAKGTAFEVQPVTPGRTDGTRTEIIEGLEAGSVVVVRNAYLLKAELGKAAAAHDH
jgi:cobalt-zinc-cadmium efflux system membrane fusion protein